MVWLSVSFDWNSYLQKHPQASLLNGQDLARVQSKYLWLLDHFVLVQPIVRRRVHPHTSPVVTAVSWKRFPGSCLYRTTSLPLPNRQYTLQGCIALATMSLRPRLVVIVMGVVHIGRILSLYNRSSWTSLWTLACCDSAAAIDCAFRIRR
jgi:hypothetical protein